MKTLLSHIDVTPKSLGAAVTAIVGMVVAFNVMPKGQAEAGGAVALTLLAILVPSRKEEGETTE